MERSGPKRPANTSPDFHSKNKRVRLSRDLEDETEDDLFNLSDNETRNTKGQSNSKKIATSLLMKTTEQTDSLKRKQTTSHLQMNGNGSNRSSSQETNEDFSDELLPLAVRISKREFENAKDTSKVLLRPLIILYGMHTNSHCVSPAILNEFL